MGFGSFMDSLRRELASEDSPEGEQDIPRETEGKSEEEVLREKEKELREKAKKDAAKASAASPEIQEKPQQKQEQTAQSSQQSTPELKISPPKPGTQDPRPKTQDLGLKVSPPKPELKISPPKVISDLVEAVSPEKKQVIGKQEKSELEVAREDAAFVSSEEKYAKEVGKGDEGGGAEDEPEDEDELKAEIDLRQAQAQAQAPRMRALQSEPEFSAQSISAIRLGIEIDKLKAQVTALREMRSISEEKFFKINEELGQLKNTIFEIEKNTVDLKKRAEIAASLVEAVQPQNLLKEVKRLELEIEKVSAIQERGTTLQDKINEELKDVRARIAVFRGADAIRELNDEMQKELVELKKTEASIEQHADKVEYIYVMFQKKFSKFEPIFQQISEITSAINRIRADTEKLKVDFKGVANKSELTELENAMRIKTESLDKFLTGSAKMQEELEAGKREVEEKLKSGAQENLEYIRKYVEGSKKDQEEALKEFYEQSEGILAKLKEYQKTSQGEISELVSELRETATGVEGELSRKVSAAERDLSETREGLARLEGRMEGLSRLESRSLDFEDGVRRISEIEKQEREMRAEVRRLEDGVEKLVRKLVEEVNEELSGFSGIARRIEKLESGAGGSGMSPKKMEQLVEALDRKVGERLSKAEQEMSANAGSRGMRELKEEVIRLSERVRFLEGGPDRFGVASERGRQEGRIWSEDRHLIGSGQEFGEGMRSQAWEEIERGKQKSLLDEMKEEGLLEEERAGPSKPLEQRVRTIRESREEAETNLRNLETRLSKLSDLLKEKPKEAVEEKPVAREEAKVPGKIAVPAFEKQVERKDETPALAKEEKPPQKHELPEPRVEAQDPRPKTQDRGLKVSPPKPSEIAYAREERKEAVPEKPAEKMEVEEEIEKQRTAPKEKPVVEEGFESETQDPGPKTEDRRLETGDRHMPVKEYRPPPRLDVLTPKSYPKLEEKKASPGAGKWTTYPERKEEKGMEEAKLETRPSKPETENPKPDEPIQPPEYEWSPPEEHEESFRVKKGWGSGFVKKLSGILSKKEAGEPAGT